MIEMKIGEHVFEILLPGNTDIYRMKKARVIADPSCAIKKALENPIASQQLTSITKEKLKNNPDSKAVIVISDNTRPVPYKGEEGILWPVIEILLNSGIKKKNITILVATGTHRPVSEKELENMLDERVFQAGIRIKNHDCKDRENLVYLGKTTRGSEVYINKDYISADLKILTGLVESHFMAGASGGRKSICPGLIGEESTYVFHGAQMLSSNNVGNLILEDNPCHEEALEVAKMAGADFIINVTLDDEFRLTGVFAGDLEKAHLAAVERLKEYVAIPVQKQYDLVITHAGFVGINHYQAAKAAIAAEPLLKPDGKIVMAAITTDSEQVGSPLYRTILHLLKLFGAEKFKQLINSPDWVFVPEQWQVQMWAKVFSKIPQENFIYYSPLLPEADYKILPGTDGNIYLEERDRYRGRVELIAHFINNVVKHYMKKHNGNLDIAYLADGPYGVPYIN